MGFSYAYLREVTHTLYAMAGEFLFAASSAVRTVAVRHTRFGNVVAVAPLFIRFLLSSMAFISTGDEPIALTETDPIVSRFAPVLR